MVFKCYTFFRSVGIWKVNRRHVLQWLPIATPVIRIGFKQPFNPTCPHSSIPKASHADCFGGWHFTCVPNSLLCTYLSKHLYFFHHHITQVWMNLGWQHCCEEWRGSIIFLIEQRERTKISRLIESFKESRYHCWVSLLKCLSLYLLLPFFLCLCRNMPESSVPAAPLDCYQGWYIGSWKQHWDSYLYYKSFFCMV